MQMTPFAPSGAQPHQNRDIKCHSFGVDRLPFLPVGPQPHQNHPIASPPCRHPHPPTHPALPFGCPWGALGILVVIGITGVRLGSFGGPGIFGRIVRVILGVSSWHTLDIFGLIVRHGLCCGQIPLPGPKNCKRRKNLNGNRNPVKEFRGPGQGIWAQIPLP